MLFRSTVLAMLALSASAFAPSAITQKSSALMMSTEAAEAPETAFDKSLKADIRKEVG